MQLAEELQLQLASHFLEPSQKSFNYSNEKLTN